MKKYITLQIKQELEGREKKKKKKKKKKNLKQRNTILKEKKSSNKEKQKCTTHTIDPINAGGEQNIIHVSSRCGVEVDGAVKSCIVGEVKVVGLYKITWRIPVWKDRVQG